MPEMVPVSYLGRSERARDTTTTCRLTRRGHHQRRRRDRLQWQALERVRCVRGIVSSEAYHALPAVSGGGLSMKPMMAKFDLTSWRWQLAMSRNSRRVVRPFNGARSHSLSQDASSEHLSIQLAIPTNPCPMPLHLSAISQVANPSRFPKPTILAWYAPHHNMERTAVGYYPVLGRLTSLTPLTSEAGDKTAIIEASHDRPAAVRHGSEQILSKWWLNQTMFTGKASCQSSISSTSVCQGKPSRRKCRTFCKQGDAFFEKFAASNDRVNRSACQKKDGPIVSLHPQELQSGDSSV